MKTPRLFFLLQLALLLTLSLLSGFKFPEFKDTNWDTTLFLTPIGIIKNFTADNGALRSFYADISAGQVQFETWQWAAIFGVYLASAFAGAIYIRRMALPGDES